MKGEPRVIERLNGALKLELGAVNQYWLHYRLTEDWGYGKLAKKERAESMEEMHHADRLVDRIIFLEGMPNMQQIGALRIGQKPISPVSMRRANIIASHATSAAPRATTFRWSCSRICSKTKRATSISSRDS
jgi:hypothetical protein